jgi:hypothetical protein
MTEIAILEHRVVCIHVEAFMIGNGFNRCARRIHDIKGGLLSLSIHHAHLSNYMGEVAQVCLLQPVILVHMTGTFSSRSYI